MPEISYRSMVWLTYRLAATFAFGLPLVLLIWASIKKEGSIIRLLELYWKIASLMAISFLLLADYRPIGYITTFAAPVMMVSSVWYWIDLNEELSNLPPWRPLPFTTRVWRWSLSILGLISTFLAFRSLSCVLEAKSEYCLAWIEAPQGLHDIIEQLFRFLFGGEWSEGVAAFVGYLGLTAYLIGILQWILVRLPKSGRIAGGF